jgi:iron complex outermembrane receptor protein
MGLLIIAWPGQAFENSGLLSLEDLMQVEMVSGSKFSEPLNEVAAAAYVLTKDDISRIGASNLPDLLRHVPGLFVAKSNANTWAVGSRGFAGIFANKLLVMIDGRSLFSPLFSGVFWDMLDIYIPDIKRIEVIRGSGASIWGANAINGVINIITQSSVDTQASQMYVKSGNQLNHDIGSRSGFEINDNLYGRFYVKKKKFRANYHSDDNVTDQWQSTSLGLRLDGFRRNDNWRLSADVTKQDSNDINIVPVSANSEFNKMDNASWNFSGSWQRIFSASNQFAVAVHQQQQSRKSAMYSLLDKMSNVEFDHDITLLQQHKLNYGLGYRRHQLQIDTGQAFFSDSQNGDTRADILSGYVQFEFSLDQAHMLQLGTKFERHHHALNLNRGLSLDAKDSDYRADHWLPDLRYTYKANQHSSFWMSLNRNARVPSVFEQAFNVPLTELAPFSAGNPSPWLVDVSLYSTPAFKTEKSINIEAGFRQSLSTTLNFDLAVFISEYDKLRGSEDIVPVCAQTSLPAPCDLSDRVLAGKRMTNQVTANSKGFELYSNWLVSQGLTFKLNYSFVDIDFEVAVDHVNEEATETYYRHNLSLLSYWQYNAQLNVELYYQHLGGLSTRNTQNSAIPSSSNSLNLNLHYQLSLDTKVSLQLKQLLHSRSISWFEEYPGGHSSQQKQQFVIGLEMSF